MGIAQIIHEHESYVQASRDPNLGHPSLLLVAEFLDSALRMWDDDRNDAKSQVKTAIAMLRGYAANRRWATNRQQRRRIRTALHRGRHARSKNSLTGLWTLRSGCEIARAEFVSVRAISRLPSRQPSARQRPIISGAGALNGLKNSCCYRMNRYRGSRLPVVLPTKRTIAECFAMWWDRAPTRGAVGMLIRSWTTESGQGI